MIDRLKHVARLLWDNIGFVFVGLVAIYCVIHAFDPPRLNWGDSGSDYNVMGAGRHFQEYGFLKLHLTPHLLDPALINSAHDRMFIYTHYPQLPDLMNGVLRVVFRLNDLVHFRFVALAFSFASLFFIYRLLDAYWGRRAAQIGLALWITNPLWIQHSDYLHHVPYGAFFGFGSLYFLKRWLGERRPRDLAVSGTFFALLFLSSYDWWFFGPLLALLMALHHQQRVDRPAVISLATLAGCATIAVAFKLATNAWGLGGVDELIKDLKFQFAERATDEITKTDYHEGIWPTLVGRVERYFSLLFFVVTGFWLAWPYLRRRFPALATVSPQPAANPVWVLVAAIPFLYLFAEIWVAQYYPGMIVVPYFAAAFGAAAALLWGLNRAARVIAVALVAILLVSAADENLNFPTAFFPRSEIARIESRLQSLNNPEKEVLVNHVFDAPYRFYFNRKIVGMTLIPPRFANIALVSFADPVTHPRTADQKGTVFIQHKQVVDQLYDKGYYYILGRFKLWDLWANPRLHREFIDSLVHERDSTLMARVSEVGVKVDETDFYSMWVIPYVPGALQKQLWPDSAGIAPPAPRN